ncbi:TolC family protein [Caulobacter sp. BK020]|uniref:TolC family protein n=1 Tax=Caulobacter sp. BK020 TaxID=2512117 RepID=UPI001050603A|nr:TolC family protein [Caulobacter sp. BK020]TCS14934.1 NodT family efflux transporter outer membrane factor (OMF) lipoprotein [Caulobacter sp. BK020]
MHGAPRIGGDIRRMAARLSMLGLAPAFALALAGCAGGPKAELRLPAAYEAPATSSTETTLDRWWTAFNDPQLDQLIDEALAGGLDAQAAAAKLAEARATKSGALTNFLPQGDPNGSYLKQRSKSAGVTTDLKITSASFDVSWQLELFGRLPTASRVAKADFAAARFTYEGARASVASEVADSYFQARGLAIQLEDARASARVQKELYAMTERRARSGLSAAVDADRIAGDLSQSNARVASLEAQLQTQKRALLILVGRVVEPTASLSIDASVGAAPAPPTLVPGDLLTRRPDVREAQARLASAVGRANLARLAFLPTINLIPGLGHTHTSPLTASSATTASIGLAVSQPIFDVPRLMSQLGVQKAQTAQAAIAYERTLRRAFQESEAALVGLDADRRQIEMLVEGEARAERAYRSARTNYGRGLTDLQTTLSAEQAWRSTRTQLTLAQVQAVRRAVQAFQALGGGWPVNRYSSVASAK